MPYNNVRRGDVFYVRKFPTFGSEQRSARPAIVVSNDYCNATSEVVEVVYLTTQEKKPLPTHVVINSTGTKSVALCEQITSVDIERLGDFKCHLSADEMILVDQALGASVGIGRWKEHEEASAATNREYPNDERLLALVCLRFLQSVMEKKPLKILDGQGDKNEKNN